jgi:pyruvate/2-oxoglutarate/acetoin dehydrogenase E1 component
MTRLTTREALNLALADSLGADERVLVFGEDVGPLGGIFGVTRGLQERFGERRVFDTPASEAAIVGTAIGLAMSGFRPVVEMQFAAYSYPGLDQIIGHLAKYTMRTMGKVSLPVVIRMPAGGGHRPKEHHGESPETYFAHTAGLKVVSPSGPMEAYDLLTQAIRDPDPVVVLEPISLYDASEEGEPGQGALPMHQARVVRDGGAVTLVSYGAMVRECLTAADVLESEGIAAQILDMRSLAPLDADSLRDCVRYTGRAVIVHEAPRTLGLGAEISARIVEECFDRLQAPVERVASWDTPYPPPRLEHAWRPDPARIAAAAKRAVGYEPPSMDPPDPDLPF